MSRWRLVHQTIGHTQLIHLSFSGSGFEDYGAYWRYNYETIEDEPQFKYTRNQLMEDVRSVYKQVQCVSLVSGYRRQQECVAECWRIVHNSLFLHRLCLYTRSCMPMWEPGLLRSMENTSTHRDPCQPTCWVCWVYWSDLFVIEINQHNYL